MKRRRTNKSFRKDEEGEQECAQAGRRLRAPTHLEEVEHGLDIRRRSRRVARQGVRSASGTSTSTGS